MKDGCAASEEILSYYKAHHSSDAPPVIIAMTASAMERDRRLCEQAGMKDFISKPFSLPLLEAKIEQWAGTIKAARKYDTSCTSATSSPCTTVLAGQS